MPTATLRPSSDGTVTGWTTGGGSVASNIDDDPDSNDGDTTNVLSPNVIDSSAFVLVDDVPGDFDPDGISSITIKAAVKRVSSGVSGGTDTIDLYLQLYRSDESTVITTESSVCSITDTANYVLFTRTVSVSGSHSVSDWNGARLRMRQDFTGAGPPDANARMRITAAEVEVVYTAGGGGTKTFHYGSRRRRETNAIGVL